MTDKILSCGHPPSPGHAPGTGYGLTPTGLKICYECCAKADVEQMNSKGKIVLYLDEGREKGLAVVNWPGTLRIPLTGIKHGRHNIAGTRTDVWFTDHMGRPWHGVQYGRWSNLCRCKRLKS